jgi:hypothetical protein
MSQTGHSRPMHSVPVPINVRCCSDNASLRNLPEAAGELIGLFIAFVAIPRVVVGPVFLVIEGATFLLVRERVTRALLAMAMLMDVIPLSMFALHLARASR